MKILSYYDKGRISNIVWTITERYGYEVDFSLIKEDYFSYDLIYNSAILGSLYNILDYNMIVDFIKNMRTNINNDKEILTIFFICIEQCCINKNIEYIKNIANLRKYNYNRSIKTLSVLKEKDKIYNAIRLAYWHKNTDNLMIFQRSIIRLIETINKFRYVDDSLKFIDLFKEVVDIYFKFEEDNIDEKLDDVLKSDIKIKANNNKEKIFEFFEEYTSSEFNPNESIIDINFSSDSSTIYDTDDTNAKLLWQINIFFR